MNRLVSKKAIAKKQSPENFKEKRAYSVRKNNTKSVKKPRQKYRKKSNYLNFNRDYSEYEASRQELSRRGVQNVPSDESVIYVKTFQLNQNNYPLIDLTERPQKYYQKERRFFMKHSESLKTIYKADNSLYKRFSANSLYSLVPVLAQKINCPKRIVSTPKMGHFRRNRLHVLTIPPQYNNSEAFDCPSNMDLRKANLNRLDRKMIEEILDMETDMQARMCCSDTNFISNNALQQADDLPRLYLTSSSADTLMM